MLQVHISILDVIQRPVFYLKHTTDNIRTSQETHHFSTTSQTG
jgi:hypothetical protein